MFFFAFVDHCCAVCDAKGEAIKGELNEDAVVKLENDGANNDTLGLVDAVLGAVVPHSAPALAPLPVTRLPQKNEGKLE